jgi:hypothetical protein
VFKEGIHWEFIGNSLGIHLEFIGDSLGIHWGKPCVFRRISQTWSFYDVDLHRDVVHGFSTILYYSVVLCIGMVFMDSLLFWYNDGVHGFSTILHYSVVLCTVMVYMYSLLF